MRGDIGREVIVATGYVGVEDSRYQVSEQCENGSQRRTLS